MIRTKISALSDPSDVSKLLLLPESLERSFLMTARVEYLHLPSPRSGTPLLGRLLTAILIVMSEVNIKCSFDLFHSFEVAYLLAACFLRLVVP